MAIVFILFACTPHYALDPNKEISQYAHDFWGIEKGFPGGTVYAIAQTNDGYLWLGTEKGLIRFDGQQFNLISTTGNESGTSEPILGLITDAKGSLWIRALGTKIIRYSNGKFEDILTDLRRSNYKITAMNIGSDGNILIATLSNGTLRFNGEIFEPIVSEPNLPKSIIISLAESQSSELWMGTRDSGLFRFNGQEISSVTGKVTDRKINFLLPDGKNELWIGTDKGIIHWNGKILSEAERLPILAQSQILTMLKDRKGNIWIGTESKGLWRLTNNNLASNKNSNFPSSKMVTALFEDREGNLWIGSPQGLERLRDSTFLTFSIKQGLPSEENGALYADSANNLWFAPLTGGLYQLNNNRVIKITEKSLDKDIIYSITGKDNDVWIGRQQGGLTHIRFKDSVPVFNTYTEQEGLAQNSVYTIFQSSDNSIWAGTLSGGVSQFKDGKFTNFTSAEGLGSNSINDISENLDGTMWFATTNGLSSLSKGNWRNFTKSDGLPTEKINCLLKGINGEMWIGTAKGLVFYKDGKIQTFQNSPPQLNQSIFGIAEDESGSLLISTAAHIFQFERNKFISGELIEADLREFGITDGLIGISGVKRNRSVISDNAGKIWFSTNRGISLIEPLQIQTNSVPTLVHINSLMAGNKKYNLQEPIQISSDQQRITIGFVGLNLASPERVKYRFKLDGFDQDWSAPVMVKEAVYTNLSPGTYRFHIIASNRAGIWNSREAIIDFIIEPMFWQTWWFRLFCLLLAVLTIATFFRLRLYRVTKNLNIRFEERLAERTLIARELHDSLLQGVVGASMQLNVAIDQLSDESPTKPRLTKVLNTIHQVIDEGRNTVRGLRNVDSESLTSLEQKFSELWQNIEVTEKIDFRVIVNGFPKLLHPLVRDEVVRIAGEALINAVHHSNTRQIEIEIDYLMKSLRIIVRDEGCGIDPKILTEGREGHWGIIGMRERAEKIGAKIKIWSRQDFGTEVELIISSQFAYVKQSKNKSLFRWFKKGYSSKTDN